MLKHLQEVKTKNPNPFVLLMDAFILFGIYIIKGLILFIKLSAYLLIFTLFCFALYHFSAFVADSLGFVYNREVCMVLVSIMTVCFLVMCLDLDLDLD